MNLPFTTTLSSDILSYLRSLAAEKGESINKILEEIIREYEKAELARKIRLESQARAKEYAEYSDEFHSSQLHVWNTHLPKE